MSRPVLNLNHEFDLMVKYQITIESQSTISEGDDGLYFLHEIVEPYPTYDEFLHCNEFDEGNLIISSKDLNMIKYMQECRRCILVKQEVNDCLVVS